jgi:hypothetical protein
MDLSFSPHDDAFREEVCALIRDHYPPELRVANPSFSCWSRRNGGFKVRWILCSSISSNDQQIRRPKS